MRISKNTVVALRQRVTNSDGTLLDDGAQPIAYVHGGYRDIFDAIEAALDGKQAGDTVTVRLEPKDTFGLYDESLVVVASPGEFQKPPKEGDIIERDGDDDNVYRVVEVSDDKVVLNGNHPFAGMTLDFHAEVLEVREATPEEVQRAEQSLVATISRWRATKMALIYFLCTPIGLILVAGALLEWLQSGIVLNVLMVVLLLLQVMCLWLGVCQVRDLVRGGEALRVDASGVFWRGFGQTIAWADIAKVHLRGEGDHAYYTVTLADQRNFQVDTGNLSADIAQISSVFKKYLPAERLEGIAG
jgi:FKBP-type peptidyl-prolyl cis-trans isomerase SlyD